MKAPLSLRFGNAFEILLALEPVAGRAKSGPIVETVQAAQAKWNDMIKLDVFNRPTARKAAILLGV